MASRSLNRVQLIGNVVADAELRTTNSGVPFCTVVVATDRSWTTGNDELKEETQFHRIIAWSKLAEVFSNLLTKGKKVYIEGRLQSRKFTTTTGEEKISVEVVAEQMIAFDEGYKSGETSEEEPNSEEQPAGSD